MMARSCPWRSLVMVLVAGLVGLASAPSRSFAQVAVTGRVVEARTGAPIAGAAVSVEGTQITVVSDTAGRYLLVRVPPGPQTLRAERLGFAVTRLGINVPARGTIEQVLRMAETPLALEGIMVTADVAGRARGELGTASVVGADAIRERTAATLAGVLELVPGMQLQAPGLEAIAQVGLRSAPTSGTTALGGGTTAADLASFGTLVVLDGIPLSNNANLQSLGARAELTFATAAGGGVDVRRIPAASLERVEVIRGVPSARYGDLTQGAIVVDTRTAAIAPEFLARYDPRSGELATVGGWAFANGGQAASFTFDAARTRTQPGLSDDHARRLAGQLAHRVTLGVQERLTMDTRLEAFLLDDDRPENSNVRVGRASWTRERGLRLSERARLDLPFDARLVLTGSYSRVEQNAYATSPRLRGAEPFTDRTTEGRAEGRFVMGRYDAEVNVDGVPQMIYSRLELAAERGWGGWQHELRAGSELRREWNAGAGYQFDMEFPPQATFNAVQGYDRPRRFDAVPPLAHSAFYIDDRLTRTLAGDVVLNLQAGLRVDMLHEAEWWLSGARDSRVQPRLNAELMPLSWLRLRAGWGAVAKLPTLGQLHPAPQYHDVVNVNWFANDPAERLAILTTFIKDPTNPQLGFARATKAEAGFELALPDGFIQLVGFSDRVSGGISLRQDLEFVLRDRYQLSDSTLGTGVPPRILEPATRTDTIPVLVGRPDNLVMQRNRGLELIALLPQIRPIRTRLELQAVWMRSRLESDGYFHGRADRFSTFQINETIPRTPYWLAGIEEGERVMATYRVVHHQPSLGFVVTAAIQHNIHDRQRDRTAVDTLAFEGFVTRAAERVPVPPEARGAPEYQDLRVPRGNTLIEPRSAPADWLATVQVSKTLPLSGRLSFWAFNVMDNPGEYAGPNTQRRVYPRMRFGLELSASTGAFGRLLP
jgi:outer membrane receptor protein involved in Fe transport